MRMAILALAFCLVLILAQGIALSQWEPTSGPSSASVLSLAVRGTNLFAGTWNGGGVFRSTDNGNSWVPTNEGLLNIWAFPTLAVGPSKIYAGSWNSGVYFSTDDGASWTQVNNYQMKYTVVDAIAINGNNVFAGCWNGLWRSTDDGSSWAAVNSGFPTGTRVRSLAISGMNVFAGTWGNGVFRSTDNGSSWVAVNSGLTDLRVPSLAVIGTHVFAGTYWGVCVSHDNGANWIDTGLPMLMFTSFALSPNCTGGTNVFVASYGSVYLSTDNGTSWSAGNSGLPSKWVNCLAIAGTNLFAGTDGLGVWKRLLPPITAPPVITALTAPAEPVQVNTLVNTSGSFTVTCDGNDHTAEWNWGDGSITAGIVDQNANNVSGSHIYTRAGLYSVTLTVADGANHTDTRIFQYIVVCDPNAGFVTGGGWINSPAGAYVLNPTLSGKATFGFVSQYQRGTGVARGNTEFKFRAASIDFKSTAHVWLVIDDARAQYKGSGTINGAGNYGLMLTAIDGQISGGDDKFRIKIWNWTNGDLLYDNQMGTPDDGEPTTLLGGGSIVVHRTGPAKDGSSELLPEIFALHQNSPNPFNPVTTIRYDLPEGGHVTLLVYDILGRQVTELVNETKTAGYHQATFDAGNLASGVYMYRLHSGSYTAVKRLLLLK